jgi:hypothetical protein
MGGDAAVALADIDRQISRVVAVVATRHRGSVHIGCCDLGRRGKGLRLPGSVSPGVALTIRAAGRASCPVVATSRRDSRVPGRH